MILLIDNYDSFVHNLARYIQRLGHPTAVIRSDVATPDHVGDVNPQAIVLSPGPCSPAEAGWSTELVRQFGHRLPILGVCLGHQVIGSAFGAAIVRAPSPMHGRVSQVHHGGDGLFEGVPSPMTAGRYHSLVVERATLPQELLITAQTPDGIIMGLQHRDYPVYGLQFHPESILTPHGYQLLANFLRRAGLALVADPPTLATEYQEADQKPFVEPPFPVTF